MTQEQKIEAAANMAGYDADDAVVTHETFADFDASAKSHWVDGCYNEVRGEEYPIREYSRVQMQKGQPRRRFTLVDCGDFRVIFGGN